MDPDSDTKSRKGWLTRERNGIASFADLSRILLAVIAGLVAFWQFNQQWRIENERGARAAYREFLIISMNNPELSRPDLLDQDATPIENERYFWYVNLMSQTFEEVFAHVPEVDAWVAIAEIQIAFHCGFYLGDDYDPLLYSTRFRDTVDRIIDEDPLGFCY